MTRPFKLQTNLIHGGEARPRFGGAVVLPIFQSSTYLYTGQTSYEEVRYIRLNNTPNHEVLEARLALLEGGESALVTGSGMAAISAALLGVLKQGDHLIAQKTLYGGTFGLLNRDFADFGIEVAFVDPFDSSSWSRALRPNSRVLYLESISNPLIEIGKLCALLAFARENGLLAMIDNTFATPINFRPLERGFDLVVHSCTKYLNGHTDMVAGAVIGRRDLVEQANRRLLHFGGCLDPHACFLLERGLKTLALRVNHQNSAAREISAFLEQHPRVRSVYYPTVAGSPGDPESKAWFSGFGGMLSFEVEGELEDARKFISALRIPVEAPSLGGVESLLTRPATTSHSGLSEDERKALGISNTLIRLSVGIEDVEDLVEDLDQALSKAG